MRYIVKGKSPDWFEDLKRKNTITRYREIDSSERRSLRQNLLTEQYYLCGYCCGKIDLENSINEHIVPQDVNPNLSMNYDNLIASCRGFQVHGNTCGHKKDNLYEEKRFVSPLEAQCEKYFTYYPNGEIIGMDERANSTFKLLNLNSYELVNARKNVFKQSQGFNELKLVEEIYLKPYQGELQPFCNIVKCFFDEGFYI